MEEQQKYYKEYRLSEKGKHLWAQINKLNSLVENFCSTYDESWCLMTHKYRGFIVVLSINRSVDPNEEQKVLTSSFDEGFAVNTSRQVFRDF